MAKRAAAVKAPEQKARKVGRLSGRTRLVIYIEPELFNALRAEAVKRAERSGALRLDVSSVAREAIGAWVSKRS